MELNGVYLISFLDDEVESFKLVFKDEELDLISKDIVDPNVKNIKFNYFDTQDNPRKYFLNKKNEDAYQINYFDKVIQSINNCESVNKLKYEIKLVAYNIRFIFLLTNGFSMESFFIILFSSTSIFNCMGILSESIL